MQEINREIVGDLIRKLRAEAGGSATSWAKTPPNNAISYFEHNLACAA